MSHVTQSFLDGHCSTLQGLLDWFEVDLGFAKLLFIQTDLCVLFVSHRMQYVIRYCVHPLFS